ncbi:hypothetical protein ACS0TY_011894 [Phlomoides rotata]
MEQKIILKIIFVVTVLKYNVDADQDTAIFDITKYGAKTGADITQVTFKLHYTYIHSYIFKSTKASKIVIPPGIWNLRQAHLAGPNKARIELRVAGIVQAYSDVKMLPNRQGDWITINYVHNFTLSGGGIFDGNGHDAWKLNDCNKNKSCLKLPINLSFNFIRNSTIHDVTSKNSKNFHVHCLECHQVVFVRFTVSAPADSPNTDGLHLSRSSSINVTDSIIMTGDDCISVGDGMSQLKVENVTCGPGHGISIGSLGKSVEEKDVTDIHVKNCTFINTQNGVRVKTWPSAPATLQITNLNFEDLVMVNASNPVIIDQQYCPSNLCNRHKPSLIQVSKIRIKNVKGTTSTQVAMTFSCSSSKPCKDVKIVDVDLTYSGNKGKITTHCANIKPTLGGKQIPPACR